MRTLPLLLASAVLLAAGAASAQGTPAGSSAPPTPDSSAPLGSPSNPIPQSSPTPAAQAFQLKAGDPTVVSNQPIPDTPQNRAAYGQPMSRTGKSTPATGD